MARSITTAPALGPDHGATWQLGPPALEHSVLRDADERGVACPDVQLLML